VLLESFQNRTPTIDPPTVGVNRVPSSTLDVSASVVAPVGVDVPQRV
jgi:hypothetical protein